MIAAAQKILKPPPKLSLIEWADQFRYVSAKNSASPGRWRTSLQPCAYGPMMAATSSDTNTVTIMAGTQVLKTELLINLCGFYIAQDPASILFVQPTQGAAEDFSKERFAPTVEVTPQLRELVDPPRTRTSENTITHKEFPGGTLDFVGANSPTDLASRPKRIILCDEIDKYPPSAGSEGDPLKLAEERASTFRDIGRAKFVRTCSPTFGRPTPDQPPLSRIAREYEASDQRRLFVKCKHCAHQQTLAWANVVWSRDEAGEHLPLTAGLRCAECGVVWTERERLETLDALRHASDYGWRQTAPFSCCGERQTPETWDDRGRSRCVRCGLNSPYRGHAGFHVSKLYSRRHKLAELVQEFLEAKADQQLLRKFTNTGLAELWEPKHGEEFSPSKLLSRAETYDGDDLPEAVKVVTGFCDVQGDRLEVQLVGWGKDEEAWPFQYEIIHLDPAQPDVWRELDRVILSKFKTISGRQLRVVAFGIDFGGHHGAQVLAFCRSRRGRRIFACKGVAGSKPIWPGRATQTKSKDPLYLIGVDTAKDAIYARLNIDPPEPGFRKPGFVHFPVAPNFGPEYFDQLNSERREVRKRMGQPYSVWVQIRQRNEALDTLVGALAMRKSLPRFIDNDLGFEVHAAQVAEADVIAEEVPSEGGVIAESVQAVRQNQQQRRPSFVGAHSNWMRR